jgi:hypothetical protein
MRRLDKLKEEKLTWGNAPDILKVDEAAVLARVPRSGMYEAVRLGFVPSVNFGQRRTRISKAELAKVFAPSVEASPRLMPSNDLEAQKWKVT